MSDLLYEIGCEELPPGLIKSLTNQLFENVTKGLTENNIPYNKETVKTFNTPRRIAIHITNLPGEQKIETIEVKGPSSNSAFDQKGNPTQAAIGFAKKYNLEPGELIRKKVGETEYIFAVTKIGGKATKDILKNILPESIKNTTGDKFMKWGSNDEKFARPIRWILAILGKDIIEFSYANIKSSDKTYGHRFFNNNPIALNNPQEYEKKLLEHKVMASFKDRYKKIESFIQEEANKANGRSVIDESLLEEVTNITEYPSQLLCSFDKEFLTLPPCIIETILKKHQKYFILRDKNNNLLSDFIVITNGTEVLSDDSKISDQIKKGNEKVVKARLNDGKFFYNEDLKTPFTYESRCPQLSKITFQKGLGSMEEKTNRLIKLCELIYEETKEKLSLSKDDLTKTAKLCKLDLTTHLVFELPELQGEIGSVYAKINNFNSEISTGIKEHYYPRFFQDTFPTTSSGLIVGIADKLDNIVCLFAAGKIPSGSADPFALRRQAQGIVDNILNKQLALDIPSFIKNFRSLLPTNIKDKLTPETEKLIKDFLLQRFIASMETRGYDPDIIQSVLSVGNPLQNLISTHEKISSLKAFNEENKNLFNPFLTAAKRLVRIVETNINGNIDTNLLKTEQEKTLLQNFHEIKSKKYKTTNDYLKELSGLTAPINNFFDKVLVNDPDPKIKQARQSLLKQGKDLFEQICDFNKIQDRN